MFFWIKKLFKPIFQKSIYLDHASTTPIDRRVLSVMKNVFKTGYGNPGGWYDLGVKTRHYISDARALVARWIGSQPSQVIFTRGGTEANNMALLGVIDGFKMGEPDMLPHIITSVIEHDSILEICRHLEKTGQATVSYIPCDAEGIIDIHELKKALRPETILVTVMYANNEIGTIQPIREIAKLVRWYKKQLKEKKQLIISEQYPLVHTDAIQAVNYCDINVIRLGIDMMTISGSKIYGPKSTGVLFIKNKDMINPIMFGGGQEFGLRSGTEDSAMVAGFARALEISQQVKERETERLHTLQDFFLKQLLSNKKIKLNGSKTDRLPNNINVTIGSFSGESLVIQLASKGFAVSSKSACQSDNDEESHVIAALHAANGTTGKSEEGSLRITMGRSTTKGDIKKFLKACFKIIDKK